MDYLVDFPSLYVLMNICCDRYNGLLPVYEKQIKEKSLEIRVRQKLPTEWSEFKRHRIDKPMANEFAEQMEIHAVTVDSFLKRKKGELLSHSELLYDIYTSINIGRPCLISEKQSEALIKYCDNVKVSNLLKRGKIPKYEFETLRKIQNYLVSENWAFLYENNAFLYRTQITFKSCLQVSLSFVLFNGESITLNGTYKYSENLIQFQIDDWVRTTTDKSTGDKVVESIKILSMQVFLESMEKLPYHLPGFFSYSYRKTVVNQEGHFSFYRPIIITRAEKKVKYGIIESGTEQHEKVNRNFGQDVLSTLKSSIIDIQSITKIRPFMNIFSISGLRSGDNGSI
jgi:hypothetical protein